MRTSIRDHLSFFFRGSFFLLRLAQILFDALRVKLPQFLHIKSNFRVSAEVGVPFFSLAERSKLVFQDKIQQPRVFIKVLDKGFVCLEGYLGQIDRQGRKGQENPSSL